MNDIEATKGVWIITQQEGENRINISCPIEHKQAKMITQQLHSQNRLEIYRYEDLRDLAIAILRFEKEKHSKESILNNL